MLNNKEAIQDMGGADVAVADSRATKNIVYHWSSANRVAAFLSAVMELQQDEGQGRSDQGDEWG